MTTSPEFQCPTPTLSAKPRLHPPKNSTQNSTNTFLMIEDQKGKKKVTAVVGIAEGGARTLDLEVWKYLRR
jgi:hypothetical protein